MTHPTKQKKIPHADWCNSLVIGTQERPVGRCDCGASDQPENQRSPLPAGERVGANRPVTEALTSKEYLGLDRDELRAVVRERDAEIERLRAALSALLTRYVDLVNCGDCGNWDPEKEREVIAARGALSGDSPTETRKPCSICGSTEHSHLHCYGPVHETREDEDIPTDGQLLDQLQDAFYKADSGYVCRDLSLRRELAELLVRYNREEAPSAEETKREPDKVNCGNPVMVNTEWYGPCTLPSGHEGECKRAQKASTECRGCKEGWHRQGSWHWDSIGHMHECSAQNGIGDGT